MSLHNILDYLTWRGDLPLERVPFCEVDHLVLCRLAYIPLAGAVTAALDAAPVSLGDAVELVLAEYGKKDGPELRMKEDIRLLKLLRESSRFTGMRLTGYVDIFDEHAQEQFSAVTVLLPDGSFYVAFRGTDGTLVGWKEDFNMSFAASVPAQDDAVAYLRKAAECFSGPIRLGGHSKGGNLAVYAAAFCGQDIQERLLEVRNMDGPGFTEDKVALPEYVRIMDRVHTLLPKSSVVGMLLQHAEDFSVVNSSRVGLFQHDLYSWEVVRGGFSTVESRTNSSVYLDTALKDWLAKLSDEQREKFVDGVYLVLSASGSKTLKELFSVRNPVALLRALSQLDEETRANVLEAFRLLKQSLRSSLPVLLDGLRLGPLQLGGR